MTIKRKIIVGLFISFLATGSALAQCSDLIELDCSGGWAWFGLRHDGANVAQGQTVTLPCDSAVLEAEFYFLVTGGPNGGVPSLEAGDQIHVVLIDIDGNHLMTATGAVPADVFTGWINFDFPEDLIVPAGLYHLAAYTAVPRQCSFAFCPGDDLYPDGERVASLNGLDGPWFGFGDGHDSPFRLHVNSDPVPTEARTLGDVKVLFR